MISTALEWLHRHRLTVIVDLEGKGVHVFREPQSGQYRQTFTAAGSEALVPVGLPHVRIDVSKVF